MALTDRIQKHVQKLPVSLQTEVLDFVEYLLAKAVRREDEGWLDLSLNFAMRGMEGEETPTYTVADLKVVFA